MCLCAGETRRRGVGGSLESFVSYTVQHPDFGCLIQANECLVVKPSSPPPLLLIGGPDSQVKATHIPTFRWLSVATVTSITNKEGNQFVNIEMAAVAYINFV